MTSSSSSTAGGYDVPWVEKYRPSKVSDIVATNMPCLDSKSLFATATCPISSYPIITDGFSLSIGNAGPPGTGKTTSILALAHELLGPVYKEAILELNASDDRGIDVIRNKIKMLAQKKVTLPPGRHKIIILDEADRVPLAPYFSHSFDLTLQSMEVPYVPEGLEAIIFTADGDMRQTLNNLQATYSGFRFVNQENVSKVMSQKLQETGFAHMRICDGVGSYLQLCGLLAKFSQVRKTAKAT
ncbi:replication factor C subunit 2 [Gossypium australe]|uniref:Replication factor C subunit 2 n=1 Tax=Gossypium australe TaxID=47621 RepID=A0A5B6VUP1_9ROSI|nr:replication factor C subunit 2 [Gossypium australe]